MKSLATDADRRLLAALRGTFGSSRSADIRDRILVLLVLYAFPAGFAYAVFSKGLPPLPLSTDQWTLLGMIPLTVALGVFLSWGSGHRYLFDGVSIRQVRRNGKFWKEIRIEDVVEITVDRSSRAPAMTLRTERLAMSVLLSPDLEAELQKKGEPATSASAG
jgi:hypothetical protein